jgi:hypothetical protein
MVREGKSERRVRMRERRVREKRDRRGETGEKR